MNKPFEGDTYIKGELIKLRDKFDLKNCVETGTQYGVTSLELRSIFKGSVVTIEADENYYREAASKLLGEKIVPLFGMSEVVLKSTRLPDDILYYLDAHGCEIGACPLKKELEIIASKKHLNVCIAIHDFKNPNHPEFGYDTYDYELYYEEIEPYLKKIYPDGFEYYYNSEADGARRGIIFIYPLKQIYVTNIS
jgi:hypothetical protein